MALPSIILLTSPGLIFALIEMSIWNFRSVGGVVVGAEQAHLPFLGARIAML